MPLDDNSTPTSAGIQLKTPKGTKDWVGQEVFLRNHIL
jgi:hypothetical protein